MKEFDIKDIEEIKQYLHYHYNHSYNANINTMIMWNHFYNISYECHENYMIMLYSFFDEYFWFMPYCQKEYYSTAIDRMQSISRELQIPFHISFCTEEFKEYCLNNYPHKFLYKRADYNDDYIYNLHDHLSLKGKKMQKRRNHYNFFIKENPTYEFKVLDKDKDRGDIISCFNMWNDKSHHGSSYELEGLINLLDYGVDLYCCGIYIDNKIQALSISSILNPKTVQIHVEKANIDIRGIYPALLKFVLESKYSDFEYINREDDIGIEGLRIAKTQLHPVIKLEKYEIIEKNLKLLKADYSDLKKIKKLWIKSFEDEDEITADYYFQTIYNKDNTYKLLNNNDLIGVIQLNPLNLTNNKKAYFIVGVCVKQQYHRQGCMDYMLNCILQQYKDEILILQAYNPDVYKKYGFKETHMFKEYLIPKYTYNNKSLILEPDTNKMLELYNVYIEKFKLSKKRTIQDFNNIIKRLKIYNQKIILTDTGYMIYSLHDKFNYIHEVIYKDICSLNQLIGCINDKDVYVLTDELCVLNHHYVKKISKMSNSILYDNLNYINELF